jgi:hypothetical protein
VVPHAGDTRLPCAIGATVKRIVCFDAVPDYFAAAVIADGRELMNGTLEAVKRVTRSRRHYFERQLIIITAHVALRHRLVPPLMSYSHTEAQKAQIGLRNSCAFCVVLVNPVILKSL